MALLPGDLGPSCLPESSQWNHNTHEATILRKKRKRAKRGKSDSRTRIFLLFVFPTTCRAPVVKIQPPKPTHHQPTSQQPNNKPHLPTQHPNGAGQDLPPRPHLHLPAHRPHRPRHHHRRPLRAAPRPPRPSTPSSSSTAPSTARPAAPRVSASGRSSSRACAAASALSAAATRARSTR